MTHLSNNTYNNGYYSAGEELMGWINSLDTSDFTVKKLRKYINYKVLDMRPKLEYNYGCRAVITV